MRLLAGSSKVIAGVRVFAIWFMVRMRILGSIDPPKSDQIGFGQIHKSLRLVSAWIGFAL
jgi:hypothetical protein